MSAYRIEPIYGLTTSLIKNEEGVAGFLYAPSGFGDEVWEVWPAAGNPGALPDGDRGSVPRRFPTEADALSFLGLPVAVREAA